MRLNRWVMVFSRAWRLMLASTMYQGAWVELHASGITQRRAVMPTRSYLSQVELPVTFGLATATRVESLTVTWPDGTRQAVPVDGLDREIVVREEGTKARRHGGTK